MSRVIVTETPERTYYSIRGSGVGALSQDGVYWVGQTGNMTQMYLEDIKSLRDVLNVLINDND